MDSQSPDTCGNTNRVLQAQTLAIVMLLRSSRTVKAIIEKNIYMVPYVVLNS